MSLKKVYFVRSEFDWYVSEHDDCHWLRHRDDPQVFKTEDRKKAFEVRDRLRAAPRQFAGMNLKARVVFFKKKGGQ